MTSPVRVLIADDHPMFRDGLRAALAAVPQIEIVGTAADGEQLLELVATTQPDVVLTDLTMPGVDGTAATRQIHEQFPNVKVIALTMHEDDAQLLGVLRAGARGYLVKGAEREEIVLAVLAVLAVAAGESVFSGAASQRLLDFFTSTTPSAAPVPFPNLTNRERDVLELVAQGLGNNEIAHRLALSEKSIRNNLATIYTKLEVNNRAAAVARSRDAGLGHARAQHARTAGLRRSESLAPNDRATGPERS